MFVSKSMTQKVVTTHKDADVLEVKELMEQYQIRHLPVVEPDGLLIGMITDRDIRSALPLTFYKKNKASTEEIVAPAIKVKEIMSRKLTTLSPMDTIEDALLLIQKTLVGALPVVDEKGILKGIISVRDLLRAFINVLGIEQPGTLLCILVDEKVGQLKKIVDIITEERISCGSVLVARYWEEGKRAVFPYLLTNNVINVKKRLKDAGYTLLDPMEWCMDQLPKAETRDPE
ncbi:MAG: CBS and ACT domain-containing protein [Pseudomonadota bacterium]